MAIQKATPLKKVSRKEISKEVLDKLASALTPYKKKLGEKKFNNLLKKTSKLFAESLAKANRKNNKPIAAVKKPAVPTKPAANKLKVK